METFSDNITLANLYDINGNLLKTSNSVIEQPMQFDMTHLEAGIYFVKIQSEGKVVSKRVVKID